MLPGIVDYIQCNDFIKAIISNQKRKKCFYFKLVDWEQVGQDQVQTSRASSCIQILDYNSQQTGSRKRLNYIILVGQKEVVHISFQTFFCDLFINKITPCGFFIFLRLFQSHFPAKQPPNLFKGEGVERSLMRIYKLLNCKCIYKRCCGSKLCCGGVVWRYGVLYCNITRCFSVTQSSTLVCVSVCCISVCRYALY